MISSPPATPKPAHRGTESNPPNRFEALSLERAADYDPGEDIAPQTRLLRDHSASVISYNDSPDLGFRASLNPYRGCEHGCIYCYARPTHEYLGFSAGLDFETKILVKERAPDLLRAELAARKWQPQVLTLSGVTDCYQPVERRLQLTRRCLAVLAECRNPVAIVTKNQLVTRDVDLLAELARQQAAVVYISVTTLNPELRTVMEPRTSPAAARLEAIRQLAAAGVPVGVMVAPIIPGLNDHEIPAILKAAFEAGARFAGYVLLRLPYANAPLFEDWLGKHFPGRKDNVLNRIKDIRGGRLNDPRFGTRMSGEGPAAERIGTLFEVAKRRAGMDEHGPRLSVAGFRRPATEQLELFPDGTN